MSSNLPPAAIQESLSSTQLNSTMLLTFLMGIYTMVYFSTLYIYWNRKASQRAVVVVAITVLFAVDVFQLGIQWYLLKWIFVNNGDTRGDVFIALEIEIPWIVLAGQICIFLVTVFADGLLIWRCFYVWDRSLRIIALPLFLVLAEIGIYLTPIVMGSIDKLQVSQSPTLVATLNRLLGGAIFVSVASTFVTTTLIAYRIYSVSREYTPSMGRFIHILDILVQSAVAYGLALLLQAVSIVLPFTLSNTTLYALQSYSSSMLIAVAGIAPTVMVARVALAADKISDISTAPHLSGLQFGRPKSQNETRIAISGMDTTNESNCLSSEGEKTTAVSSEQSQLKASQ